uniref:Uncharacterized protein n=1 Tax=Paraurostyla sp. TaxID=6014 RepID=A0A3Q8BBN8_9STIC|nr:hypothetical protein [Paraurostyla sp.]
MKNKKKKFLKKITQLLLIRNRFKKFKNIKKNLMKKTNSRTNFWKKKYTYKRIIRKTNMQFFLAINYNFFQINISWAKRKVFNATYFKYIKLIKINNIRFVRQITFYNKIQTRNKKKKLIDFLKYYSSVFSNSFNNIMFFFKKHKKKQSWYKLILTFRKNKMYLNLQNTLNNKNYLYLTPGFFVKFFEKKKSIKKNKNTKILMSKYLRKVYIVSKIKNQIILIKNNPIFLFLNLPIIHKFYDPLKKEIINEKKKPQFNTKTLYFIFFKNQDYCFNKKKKIGRIKRKIKRKIILQNQIPD